MKEHDPIMDIVREEMAKKRNKPKVTELCGFEVKRTNSSYKGNKNKLGDDQFECEICKKKFYKISRAK